MIEEVSIGKLYHSVSKELISQQLQNTCVVGFKYSNGAFGFSQVTSINQVLSIPPIIGNNIEKYTTKLSRLHLYYTEESKGLHDSIKEYFNSIFKFFPEWGTPACRYEPCYVDCKVYVSKNDIIVKFNKARRTEILNPMPALIATEDFIVETTTNPQLSRKKTKLASVV